LLLGVFDSKRLAASVLKHFSPHIETFSREHEISITPSSPSIFVSLRRYYWVILIDDSRCYSFGNSTSSYKVVLPRSKLTATLTSVDVASRAHVNMNLQWSPVLPLLIIVINPAYRPSLLPISQLRPSLVFVFVVSSRHSMCPKHAARFRLSSRYRLVGCFCWKGGTEKDGGC
jgi:hypothetical protein